MSLVEWLISSSVHQFLNKKYLDKLLSHLDEMKSFYIISINKYILKEYEAINKL